MFDFELKIGLKFIFARKTARSLGRKSLSLQNGLLFYYYKIWHIVIMTVALWIFELKR